MVLNGPLSARKSVRIPSRVATTMEWCSKTEFPKIVVRRHVAGCLAHEVCP